MNMALILGLKNETVGEFGYKIEEYKAKELNNKIK